MRLGIFAKTFPGSNPATVLTAARAAGYACVQYNMACSGLPSMPDTVSAGTAEAVADAARAAGVDVVALSATFNMIHPDPAVRTQGLRSLGRLAAAAPAMGTRPLTLCTGTRDAADMWRHHPDNASPEAWRDLRATLETALDLAERHDVMLGIEPERANVIDSAEKAQRLIAEMASPALRIVLDPANLVETESVEEQRRIVADAIDRLGDRIAIAHAKDRHADGRFAIAGTGVIDFPHVIACLRRAGFDGPLVTHGLDATEAPGVARFLQNVLDTA